MGRGGMSGEEKGGKGQGREDKTRKENGMRAKVEKGR